MNLEKVNIALGNRITGGSEFIWKCYGPNAWFLDYSSDYGRASAIFDNQTHIVYECMVTNSAETIRPYRWMDPNYKEAFEAECKTRGLLPDIYCDDIKYIDLEVESDFLEKADAIFNNKKFDTRVVVPLDIDDELFLHLAKEAHKKDITINKMIEYILSRLIERENNEKNSV